MKAKRGMGTTWRVGELLWGAVLLACVIPATVDAQNAGILSRQLCSSVLNPISGRTICFDQTANYWTGFDGTGWQSGAALATKVINAGDPRWTSLQAVHDAAPVGSTILVPLGTYATIPGLTITKRLTFIFDDTAGSRTLTGTISVQMANVSLIGMRVGSNNTGVTPSGATFVWGGAANGIMLETNPPGTVFSGQFNGLHINGLSFDGGGVSGVTAMKLSRTDGSVAGNSFSLFENIMATNVKFGLILGDGLQQNHFRKIVLTNDGAIVAGSIGVQVAPANTGQVVANYMNALTVQGFDTLIKVGNTTTSLNPGTLTISNSIIENFTTAAVELVNGLDITFFDNHFEGTDSTTKRLFKIGTTGAIQGLVIEKNYMAGVQGGGAHIEGFRWLGMIITRNYFDASGAGKIFLNTGGGTRLGGKYYGNNTAGSGFALTEIDDPTGFEYIVQSNPTAAGGNASFPSQALGGATLGQAQLALAGTYNGLSVARGIQVGTTLVPVAGNDIVGLYLTPAFTEAASGDHGFEAGLYVAPTVTNGVATTADFMGMRVGALTAAAGTTNASAIKVDNAPTGATNNRALWVAGGGIAVGASVADQGTGTINGATGYFLNGTQGLRATGTPTCSANCGTSPSVTGTDSMMTVTLGTSPPAASTFTVSFSSAWTAAPSCIATRQTTGTTPVVAGAVAGTASVVINLSANMVASEKYNIHCGGIS